MTTIHVRQIQLTKMYIRKTTPSEEMNMNTRNLKIGMKFKICVLFSPLYCNKYGLWFNK
jgi:hypothetical protein